MKTTIEVRGLEELQRRFQAFPEKFAAAAKTTMEAALLTLWENVPAYPAQPEDSRYDRTETLGRTLGSGMQGGKASGKPDIFTVKYGGDAVGQFGTKLEYGPYVIGDENQAWMHQGRWWQMKDIAERSSEKIQRLFEIMADKLAAFLEGQNTS